MKRTITIIAALIFTGGLGSYAGYRYALSSAAAKSDTRHGVSNIATSDPADKAEQALYWYDPMRPDQHFDQPGKSPFMDMQLVAKYAGEKTDDANAVKVSEQAAQNLGWRTALVERRPLIHRINAAAVITLNERLASNIQARSDAFVERVYSHAVGDWLAAATALADLRIPQWTAAQQEWLSLQNEDKALRKAVDARLRALGMSETEINQLAQTQQAQTVFTIKTEHAGLLQEWPLRAGMVIAQGQTLAKLNAYNSVWLDIALAPADADRVHEKNHIAVQWQGNNARRFDAIIESILPLINVESRTLTARARIDFSTPAIANNAKQSPPYSLQSHLRPGAYAQVIIESLDRSDVLQVPSDAVIVTGTRSVVLRAKDTGHYEPVSVELGREADGWSEIRSGLHEGERVVVSGQFLIDSEASLRGLLQKLDSDKAMNDQTDTGVAP